MKNELKDFSMAFKITNFVLFEVRYNHVGDNEDADFATSAVKFTRNKKSYESAGQCQDDVLPKESKAYKFYQKWDTKHLNTLDAEEYSELLNDLETLKSNYEFIYKEGNRDFNWFDLLELSKIKTKKVDESKLEEDDGMEDNEMNEIEQAEYDEEAEQFLREKVQKMCEEDGDVRFRDVDATTEEFTDTIIADTVTYNKESGDMYNDTDDDEYRQWVYDIVHEEVESYMEGIDIYTLADEWDGNGYTNYLDDYEWKEIFENAPEIYKGALDARAGWVKGWWGEMPDLVWDVLIENVDEQLGFNNYNPMSVIDNAIVNGSYGDFDDFKDENETDEEFIAREEDNCCRIFPEERFIIYSL